MATVNEQLMAAIKAADEATKLVTELKKQNRKADLAKVKALIKMHEFGPTDLRNVIKAKGKSKNSEDAATEKVTDSPRKSTATKRTYTRKNKSVTA